MTYLRQLRRQARGAHASQGRRELLGLQQLSKMQVAVAYGGGVEESNFRKYANIQAQ